MKIKFFQTHKRLLKTSFFLVVVWGFGVFVALASLTELGTDTRLSDMGSSDGVTSYGTFFPAIAYIANQL